MPMIATKVGWEKNPETGEEEYVVRLLCEREEDIPDLKARDVWDKTPLSLSRKDG